MTYTTRARLLAATLGSLLVTSLAAAGPRQGREALTLRQARCALKGKIVALGAETRDRGIARETLHHSARRQGQRLLTAANAVNFESWLSLAFDYPTLSLAVLQLVAEETCLEQHGGPQ